MDLKQFNKNKGFSLIEILVSVLIISSLSITVFSLIIQSIKVTANNKHTLSANTLVNKRLEYIRSLPYDDVGTISGFVSGLIPGTEMITSNNGAFTLNTYVNYVDDPFDGTDLGVPLDTVPNDYKIVRVKASWSSSFRTDSVTGYTTIAPRSVETALGGGTLSISVHDASGLPVNGAVINIINNNVLPVINIPGDLTNVNGILNFFGAPQSIESYEISATKPGYSIDATFPRTATNTNPTKPHSTVLENQRTNISFAIDLLSNLNINVITANLPNNFIVSNDTSAKNQTNSRMTMDSSGNMYIVWQDYRLSSAAKIYAQKYNSSGTALWGAGTDIIVGTANNQVLPDIDIDTFGNLYVVWNDDSEGNQDSYIVQLSSATGADTWGGDKKIATLATNMDQTSPRLKVSTNNGNTYINVVFEDNRDSELDVYAQRYDITGTPVWGNEIKVNTNPIADNTNQYSPYINVSSQEELFIIWTDERNGKLDVYAQKYASSGIAVWAQDLMIPSQATSSAQFSLSTPIDTDSFDNVYAVWTDARNGDEDIYAQKYDINGNPLWLPNDLKMNSDLSSSTQSQPAIAVDSLNNFYIVWTDDRNGNQDIYGQKYDSNGNALWSADMRINIDTNSYNQYNPNITINPVDNQPYVTWESDDAGDKNIYASTFSDYSVETPLNNISVLIRGAKKIGENPIIYKYEKTYASNASGDIALIGIEWDSYSFEIDATSTSYNLLMTIPSMPLNIDPNANKSIKLYLQ